MDVCCLVAYTCFTRFNPSACCCWASCVFLRSGCVVHVNVYSSVFVRGIYMCSACVLPCRASLPLFEIDLTRRRQKRRTPVMQRTQGPWHSQGSILGGLLARTQPFAKFVSQPNVWVPNGLFPPGNPRWGAKPPTSIDGLPGGKRPFGPQNRELRKTSQRVGSLPGALRYKRLPGGSH